MCKDANCKRVEHKRDLCSMYDNVVSALYDGGKPFYKTDTQNKKINIRPGWNEHVAMYHTEAREAYKLWDMAGKPKQSPELQHTKLANARFKYAVRFISKNEQLMRAVSMANKIMCNNSTNFWR